MKKDTFPKVFVHGSFANANSWRKIIEKLDDESSCISINLPGHGGVSDPNDFDLPTFEPEYSAIKEAIKGINEGIHLIGHSFGGVVALAAALDGMLPIKKLTLFEPVAVAVLDIFGQSDAFHKVNQFVNEYERAALRGEEFACAHVIDFWGGAGSFDTIPKHVKTAMAEMTKNNLRHWHLCQKSSISIEIYKSLNIPVTLVHGSKSNPIAKLITQELDKNLPQSKLFIIEGASHFMITSHADDCVEILKKDTN